jgi:hypothetical protein
LTHHGQFFVFASSNAVRPNKPTYGSVTSRERQSELVQNRPSERPAVLQTISSVTKMKIKAYVGYFHVARDPLNAASDLTKIAQDSLPSKARNPIGSKSIQNGDACSQKVTI